MPYKVSKSCFDAAHCEASKDCDVFATATAVRTAHLVAPWPTTGCFFFTVRTVCRTAVLYFVFWNPRSTVLRMQSERAGEPNFFQQQKIVGGAAGLLRYTHSIKGWSLHR